MIPKGSLIIIGGKEDKAENKSEMQTVNHDFSSNEILKDLVKDKKDRIEVITSASAEPESLEEDYRNTFNEIGYKNFGFIHFTKENPSQEDDIERIKNAKTVFFSGGDQERLYNSVNRSFIDVLKNKYLHDEDFTIAGTSAGAMCIPEIMISEALNAEAMVGYDIELKKGFGLISKCIVDTHFVHRGRFGRLAHAVILNQEVWGLGLGEDTALLVKNGSLATCIGSGMATVISAEDLGKTNVKNVEKGEPVFAENLKVHILTDGCIIDLENRTIKMTNKNNKNKKRNEEVK
ncbi:cyanophycinase [Chryseobacterium sp. GMJ5]|uniref:Cyanophycinase n=1 Tax=Chryseobacterium gilvum TaxID=2976534 RepID=A0ABT2VV65_9FLAO|nr:cyanophycinase [Chryseobacterium gilvum]MCU7613499.1 cyanophycinase [Chryseobacterium gilvum]